MDWTRGRPVRFPKEKADLAEYFQDFLTGLTYPQIWDEKSDSQCWRESQAVLSGAWHYLLMNSNKCPMAQGK